MAPKKDQDKDQDTAVDVAGQDVEAIASHEATPGVTKEAEVIDAPLAIAGVGGPRDALVDRQEGDIIPDFEEKGYHVGLVRQPAQVVGVGGRVQGFRAQADMPSRFPTLRDTKAAHNARESKAGDSFGVAASPDPSARVTTVRIVDDGS